MARVIDFLTLTDPPATRAGLDPAERLGYPVVWWDPRTLRLDIDAHFGIRQEELL